MEVLHQIKKILLDDPEIVRILGYKRYPNRILKRALVKHFDVEIIDLKHLRYYTTIKHLFVLNRSIILKRSYLISKYNPKWCVPSVYVYSNPMFYRFQWLLQPVVEMMEINQFSNNLGITIYQEMIEKFGLPHAVDFAVKNIGIYQGEYKLVDW